MNPFKPTHIIEAEGKRVPVMAEASEEGGYILYTQLEWEDDYPADWELNDEGALLFQGYQIDGSSIEKIR